MVLQAHLENLCGGVENDRLCQQQDHVSFDRGERRLRPAQGAVEQACIAQLLARARAQEPADLIAKGHLLRRCLLLKRQERARVALLYEDLLQDVGPDGTDKLVLQVSRPCRLARVSTAI